jgi:hypothetical protein
VAEKRRRHEVVVTRWSQGDRGQQHSSKVEGGGSRREGLGVVLLQGEEENGAGGVKGRHQRTLEKESSVGEGNVT